MSGNCTCVLAKPANALGFATFHTALCSQHGASQSAGTPVDSKSAGLFFARAAGVQPSEPAGQQTARATMMKPMLQPSQTLALATSLMMTRQAM